MSNEPRPRAAVPGAIRALRWVLLALLFAAAAGLLLGLPGAAERGWPRLERLVPVLLLVLFVGGYAAYRFALVRAGRYPEGKALVRVGLMVILLAVVASIALDRTPATQAGLDLAGPLGSPDPQVRALAAELLRHRPPQEGQRHAERLLTLAEDPAPEVRHEARATLVALLGEDLGEGAGSAAAWRALCQRRGLLQPR